MKNTKFKYKTFTVFFDADYVPCVFTDEILKAYPKLKKEDEFWEKTWEIPDGNGYEVSVMSAADAGDFIWEYGK